MNRLLKIVVHALFWPWNLAFIALISFGYVPLALIDLVADAAAGLAPWDFVLGSFVLVLVPILSTVFALRSLRRRPADLALLFFGAELPVFFFVLARLFGFQDLTGAAWVVVASLVTGGLAALVLVLLDERVTAFPRIGLALHAGLATVAVVGSYVGVILGLWALPTLGKGVVGFFVAVGGIVRDISIGGVGAALVSFFPLLWFALTLVVVLLLPLVTPVLWVGMLSRSTAAKAQQHGAGVVAVCTVAPVVIVAVAFVATLAPPHAEMVDRIAAAHDDASRQALLDDRNAISAALVDAHLARHRTFSSLDAVDARNAWAHEWNEFVPTPVAETIGNFAAGLARPFIFQGTTADIAAAGQLHRDFFGTHLERAHAKAVQQALSATWSREQRYAGFINEGQRRVRLVRQDVSAKSAGGVATVEVHDEWSNLTLADEEVALVFELPESAALTGLC